MRIEEKPPGFIYKILRIITVIQPSEGLTAFFFALIFFLLFLAYYIIKPVRDSLILAGKGAEMKSYLSAAIAILLVFVVKAFCTIASKFPRQKLITWVTLFFISNLVIFYLLSLGNISLGTIGILFFIWCGIFNVMVVAQFWGFANDIYKEEAGKRLFPLLAFGATFGGYSGSTILEWLVEPLGLYQMMLVAGGFLGICVFLTWIVHTRELKRAKHSVTKVSPQEESSQKEQEKPLEKGGGFRLVFKKRYILYIALFVMLLNFVNTNGEFIKDRSFEKMAKEAVETGTAGGLNEEEYLGKISAGWMKYFNLIAMFIQIFIVSRIFKWLGVRAAIFFLPIITLGGYFLIALIASFGLVYWVKAIENGTDYSLMNTTRHSLFLITSRQEKYKAQAATKTFFHRAGDVLSALIVFLGTTYWAFNTKRFAAFNVVLIVIWIILGILIFREHKRLSAERRPYQEG